MNDTHPTLCIPELMKILIDVKGLGWERAWKVTQRTVAYTNHTVLPGALEKWSFELMQKLLPCHVQIIEMIDEELVNTIVSEYGEEDSELLKKKLDQMRILENFDLPDSVVDLIKEKEALREKELELSVEDDESKVEEVGIVESTTLELEEPKEKHAQRKQNPKKEPAPKLPKMVRIVNLSVVAEIHSEFVKDQVFNDFYKLWPEKFQNNTNGVTSRRWIHFCNPELSRVITKWIGSEDWVLDTEKLAEL